MGALIAILVLPLVLMALAAYVLLRVVVGFVRVTFGLMFALRRPTVRVRL